MDKEFSKSLHNFAVGETVLARPRYIGRGFYGGDEITVTLAHKEWDSSGDQWVYQTTDGRRVVGR